MVPKFHMWNDEAAGLKNDKTPPGRESKLAAVAKVAEPIKSTFLQNHLTYLAEILYRALFGP